jgi:HK97 family phage major capsid protein
MDEKKLRGMIDDVVSGRLGEVKVEQEERDEASAKRLEALDTSVKNQLEALANKPAVPMDVPVPGTSRTVRLYKGYNLDRQCMSLKVINQEKRDMIATTVVDALERAMSAAGRPMVYTKAALAEGAAATGGNLVPDEFADELLAYARLQSLALQKCRIWPMAGMVLYIPGEDGTVTVAYTNEATAATQTEPTYLQKTLTAKRLDAFSQMSAEVEADASIDLVSNLFEQYAQAIAVQLDSDLFVGASPFTGIGSDGGVNEIDMVSGDTEFKDIDAIYYSQMIGELPVNKVGTPAFYFGRDIGHRTRSLSDTTGQLIWGQFAGAEPSQIYGVPYHVSDAFPADDVSTMAVVYGDLNRVALGMRQGMEFMIDPYSLFTASQVQTRVTMRVAMVVAQPDGLVRLITAAT